MDVFKHVAKYKKFRSEYLYSYYLDSTIGILFYHLSQISQPKVFF